MTAATVDADEAGPLLPDLLARARGGETISIVQGGEEIARLTPPERAAEKLRRQGGWMKGEIWMAPDFDETPQEIIDLFEGKESDL